MYDVIWKLSAHSPWLSPLFSHLLLFFMASTGIKGGEKLFSFHYLFPSGSWATSVQQILHGPRFFFSIKDPFEQLDLALAEFTAIRQLLRTIYRCVFAAAWRSHSFKKSLKNAKYFRCICFHHESGGWTRKQGPLYIVNTCVKVIGRHKCFEMWLHSQVEDRHEYK